MANAVAEQLPCREACWHALEQDLVSLLLHNRGGGERYVGIPIQMV